MDPIVAWLVGAAAAVTALGVLWTRLLKPLLKLIRQLVRLGDILEAIAPYLATLPAMLPSMLAVAEQFEKNGGTTMRDRVDAIAGQASHLESAMANVEERLEAMERHHEQQRYRWAAGEDE